MAQAGRPPGVKYSVMVSFVVTDEMAAAIKARAAQEQRAVSDWLRMTAAKALEAQRE